MPRPLSAPAIYGYRFPAAVALCVAFFISLPGATESGAAHSTPVRVECERPARLRLRRFEDRSARLLCAGRTLVRISAPG